jgi:putative Mn2+ efflux pump MntP
VSLATSIRLQPLQRRQVFRYAFHFGLFQAGMPILGWFAGQSFVEKIAAFDHWIAFTLLALVGGRALWGALGDNAEKSREEIRDPTRGMSLIVNSVATSIDAFAVGLSFACLNVPVWYPALVIGVVTAALSVLGMHLGSRLGARFGKIMEIVGGLVLIVIGIRILVEHIF